MDRENTGNKQLPPEPFKDLKERLDKIMPSPEERAGKVYALIHEHEMQTWDIICFCMVFVTNSCAMFEFLKPIAKAFHTTVYLAHYKAPDELGILPKQENDS